MEPLEASDSRRARRYLNEIQSIIGDLVSHSELAACLEGEKTLTVEGLSEQLGVERSKYEKLKSELSAAQEAIGQRDDEINKLKRQNVVYEQELKEQNEKAVLQVQSLTASVRELQNLLTRKKKAFDDATEQLQLTEKANCTTSAALSNCESRLEMVKAEHTRSQQSHSAEMSNLLTQLKQKDIHITHLTEIHKQEIQAEIERGRIEVVQMAHNLTQAERREKEALRSLELSRSEHLVAESYRDLATRYKKRLDTVEVQLSEYERMKREMNELKFKVTDYDSITLHNREATQRISQLELSNAHLTTHLSLWLEAANDIIKSSGRGFQQGNKAGSVPTGDQAHSVGSLDSTHSAHSPDSGDSAHSPDSGDSAHSPHLSPELLRLAVLEMRSNGSTAMSEKQAAVTEIHGLTQRLSASEVRLATSLTEVEALKTQIHSLNQMRDRLEIELTKSKAEIEVQNQCLIAQNKTLPLPPIQETHPKSPTSSSTDSSFTTPIVREDSLARQRLDREVGLLRDECANLQTERQQLKESLEMCAKSQQALASENFELKEKLEASAKRAKLTQPAPSSLSLTQPTPTSLNQPDSSSLTPLTHLTHQPPLSDSGSESANPQVVNQSNESQALREGMKQVIEQKEKYRRERNEAIQKNALLRDFYKNEISTVHSVLGALLGWDIKLERAGGELIITLMSIFSKSRHSGFFTFRLKENLIPQLSTLTSLASLTEALAALNSRTSKPEKDSGTVECGAVESVSQSSTLSTGENKINRNSSKNIKDITKNKNNILFNLRFGGKYLNHKWPTNDLWTIALSGVIGYSPLLAMMCLEEFNTIAHQ
eukprot:GHVN01026266.1.p1 GENE.GHVN01026266.1~~GHVN01026266.1.p1  ORF type:complete len:828 (+),score=260.43 GHVN01026266.1:293-2776(+)